MSETLRHRAKLRGVLEREFGDPSADAAPSQPVREQRTVLPMLGGSGPDEYDFSSSEYLLRRWRREVDERRTSTPARQRRLQRVRDLFE